MQALMEVQTGMASGFEAPTDKLSRADKLMPFLGDGGNGECCNCTKGSAKWVMDHVISSIKKKCNETECEKFKKMCEKAAEHPQVAFGYLIGERLANVLETTTDAVSVGQGFRACCPSPSRLYLHCYVASSAACPFL